MKVYYPLIWQKKLNFSHKIINLGTKELKILNKSYLESIRTLSDDGFNVYVACQKISKDRKKVALCGLGGDEIFLGYNFYNRAALINRISLIVGDKITRLRIKFFMRRKGRKVYEFPLPLTKIENIYLAFRIQPNECYNWDTNRVYLQTLSKDLNLNLHGLKKISLLRKLAYLDQIFYMRSQLIKVSDLASMEHSIEMRVPLLDIDILKFSLSLQILKYKAKKY
jgi:asparagine synthase (glutamine-hydrolysing)